MNSRKILLALLALGATPITRDVHRRRGVVDLGGFMSYAPNGLAAYRTAARFVDRILRGAKPADIPVEQPTVLELVINLKTTKALGLKIPPSLLMRADRVIE